MTETETVRCWLVERTYDDKGLIRMVYAPADGGEQYVTEKAAATGADTAAAIEVEPDKLDPVDDEAVRERYAQEVDRMADRHEPDESV